MTVSSPAIEPIARLDRFNGLPGRAVVFHRLSELPPRQPRMEVIAGLAAAGEVVALVGAPGSGKSALAALLARAVADGLDFLGRSVLAGTVIYIAAERVAEVERRLKAAASADAAVYVTDSRPQLADGASIASLVEAIADVEADVSAPIRLIVIDTAARCLRELDENSAKDMGLAAEGMARIIQAYPTAVLVVVHHLGKSGATMRGSGALLGAIDLELTVRRTGEGRRMEVTKANTVAEGQRLPFRLVPAPSVGGLSIITAEGIAPESSGSPNAPRASTASRLPPDAATALKELRTLAECSETVSREQWREATMLAFGDRKSDAKRAAWSKASKLLLERKLISINGDAVSVSKA